MRASVLLNPQAGTADQERLQACLRHHSGVELWRLPSPEAVPGMVREAVRRGASRVVAAGGDGTIHQVANALLEVPGGVGLGILPCGTGNDLARTLGVPRLWAPALATALAAPLRRMDVLHLADDTGRATHVANGVAAGFAGEVSNAVTQEAKERWGHMAFVMAAGTALSRLKPFRLRLTLDGALMEAKAVALLVMNGATIGGHRHVAPRAQPFDGKMDVVVVRHGALPRLLATGARLLQRRWPHDPQVAAFRCRRLHVTADEPLALTVDGETWGHRPCTVTVRPGALRVATTSLDGHCTA